MKSGKETMLLNVLIVLDIVFFALCSFVLIINSTKRFIEVLFLISIILQVLLGMCIFFLSIFVTRKAYHLYMGSLFVGWGFFTVIFTYSPEIGFTQGWPIFGIVTGVLYLFSGFYKYKKIKFGYLIPSMTLILMSVWYSMFSFKIIKKSFLSLAGTLGPVFMLLIALSLVILFLAQQKHKELVFPDDETGTFSDEEVITSRIE